MMGVLARMVLAGFLLLLGLGIPSDSLAVDSRHVRADPHAAFHDMVFIPAGVFAMGSSDQHGSADEYPQHSVTLQAFYLDMFEASNRQFRRFVKQTRYKTTAEIQGKGWAYVKDTEWTEVPRAWWRKPEGRDSVFSSKRGSHPVVMLSWHDAQAYCQSQGKRLPTEAEWEYAARAGSAINSWWGGKSDGSRRVGNVADQTLKGEFPGRPWPILKNYMDHYVRTAPVGAFEPNAWGLYDMIGNVSEWVADWYDGDYYSTSPSDNPRGPSTGHFKVLRGGSWSTSPTYLGTGVRIYNAPATANAAHGVRCAKDVEQR